MTSNKILCFGELFIDMFASNDTAEKNTCFFQHAGGSPGIVSFALANYGATSYFIGKLSDDHFADYLVDYMKKNGVNMEYSIRSKEHRCTISFVRQDSKGERYFEIYRDSNKAADLAFGAQEWQDEWFKDASILHCGSNCQVSKASHQATLEGVKLAKQHNTLVSYDPNFRLNIWQDHELMSSRINEIFPYADIIKMSDEEASFLFPDKTEEEISQKLFDMLCEIMFITRGSNGASVYHPNHSPIHLPPIKINQVDTTGAGDNFVAALLFKLTELNLVDKITKLDTADLKSLISFAHKGATLSVSQRGGMDSSPSLADVESLSI